MITLHFSIKIKATKEKVWNALWEDKNYRNWTTAFCEGSYAESEWKEGSSIKFLGPDGGGMISRIDKLIPNEYMSFEHLGEMKNGVEQAQDEKSKEWAGSKENYTLIENNGVVEVKVDIDVTESFVEVFSKMWPDALERLKKIAESN